MNIEQQYLDLLKELLNQGIEKEDRTNTGTLSLFGRTLRHDFKEGFPLLTTKKVFWKGIAYELLFFLRGEENIKFLEENNVGQIWKPWADEKGNIGQIYGCQWRNWNQEGIDQLNIIINEIKKNPNSRRHLVLAWNPLIVWNKECALPPCHYAFQFVVENNKLNLLYLMRSSDVFIGLPFNIASYALLLNMVCHLAKLKPGELLFVGGDVHLYKNHVDQAKEQMKRVPNEFPQLIVKRDVARIDDFCYDDFELVGYNPHPAIKAPVAI